jgi:hypothetical protein
MVTELRAGVPGPAPREAGTNSLGSNQISERAAQMLDFFSNTWVMVGMAVVLLALIGLLIFLRTRPQDE